MFFRLFMLLVLVMRRLVLRHLFCWLRLGRREFMMWWNERNLEGRN